MSKTTVSHVTPFHTDIYAAAMIGHKATTTVAQKMQALIVSKYGTVAPTYEQYRADQAVLASIAKDKDLADNQWVRKPYAQAITAAFGALPESQSPAAVAKRVLREKSGAPKNVVASRNASSNEQIEQFIAKAGVFAVLSTLTKMLAVDTSTKEAAKALVAVQGTLVAKAA